MWWPSFCSVLHDLWLFITGHGSASNQTTLSQPDTQREPVQTPVLPSVAPIVQRVQVVQLQTGTLYSAQHPDVKKIRVYLDSQANLKSSTGELTTYEWLAYLYTNSGRPLPWLAVAMMPAGQWHQVLKGLPYVTISLEPKTEALIEWREASTVGRLGVVVSVSPNQTIVVRELGFESPGVLTETTYTQADWKELRPVFISVV